MEDLRGLTGIVAVDRSAMGEIVRESLVGCNMKVPMLVDNLDSALVACETHQPDAIFISFVFNKKPALELIKFIRKSRGGVGRVDPHLPIIITSHKANPKQVKASLQAGANEFLALPASRDALTSAVDRAANAQRDWIEVKSYIGPDRRRRQLPNLPFPDRRKSNATQSMGDNHDDHDDSIEI